MGVAGSGKTTVGEALAPRIGATYVDGDTLHPAANIAKMSAGQPLTDEDRWPWLAKVAERLRDGPPPLIVGCSALKRSYRRFIEDHAGGSVLFVLLDGSRALLESRLGDREGHFMPPSLLDSQLATLERPGADEFAVAVSIDAPLPVLVDDIARRLEAASGSTVTP
jgi:gluconokinase